MDQDMLNRPTWAEIDLESLAFNFHSAKAFIGSEIGYMAVVKANAYGHGAAECALCLEKEGIDMLAVALPEEGVELRKAGLRKPILCLGGFWHGQENLLLANELIPVVYRADQSAALDRTAKARGIEAKIHVKIDTGMGRIGVRYDDVEKLAQELNSCSNLRVDGLMTHFAAADDPNQDEFTALQISRFRTVTQIFIDLGFRPTYIDLANSPAAVAHPGSRGNMVRLGGILYGLGDDVLSKTSTKPKLRPVMSVKTRIAHLKTVRKGETLGYGRTFTAENDLRVATVPIGYHDGYARRLSNIGKAIVNGEYVPVVGRISMDWTLLDVTRAEKASIGDEVIMIGRWGDNEVKASELAGLTQTISYEITCGISNRVPRIYLGKSADR